MTAVPASAPAPSPVPAAVIPTVVSIAGADVDHALRTVRIEFAQVIANQALAHAANKTAIDFVALGQATEVLAALDLALPILQAAR